MTVLYLTTLFLQRKNVLPTIFTEFTSLRMFWKVLWFLVCFQYTFDPWPCQETNKHFTVSSGSHNSLYIFSKLKFETLLFSQEKLKRRTQYTCIKYGKLLRKLVSNIDAQRNSGILYTLRAFNNEFYPNSHDIVDLSSSWNKLPTYAEISFSSKHWRLWTWHLQELKVVCRIGSLFWIASQKGLSVDSLQFCSRTRWFSIQV